MNRPYVFCHMLTSLDGKIMGNYMDSKAGEQAGQVFYQIAFGKERYYQHQGWLSGRVTTDDNFTFYEKPDITKEDSSVPEGDFLIPSPYDMYYVSIDPMGKLGWKSNELLYEDTKASVLEVLSEQASVAYRAFLRRNQISYIIAGDRELDASIALWKLKEKVGIQLLMLGGGGVLNWSFIQQGLCDEISLVIASSADGSCHTPTLFEVREGLSNEQSMEFQIQHCEIVDGNCLWLRYQVKQEEC